MLLGRWVNAAARQSDVKDLADLYILFLTTF